MAIVLFVVSLISSWLILLLNEARKEERLRVSFLKALIVQACLSVGSTEAFSLVRSLDFTHVALFWGLISIVNCSVLGSRYRNVLKLNVLQNLIEPWKPSTKRAILIISTIAFISLITALIAPPNNYDSLTYHMPRVMQWIQNQSLDYYPTHNLRQLFLPPGASYIVAHLQILSGGDYFANCVQWFAYVGSIVGVSLLAKHLVDDRAQWISAIVCATIPMAIMQSTTTQTDLVTSLWLVCFAYFVFQFRDRADLFWLAASFGLAIVTKPTGLLFGMPLFFVFAVLIDRHSQSIPRLTSLKYCATVGLGSLVLPMASWVRNIRAVGKPFGEDFATRSEIQSIAELFSNLLKNAALNLPIPGAIASINFLHQHLLSVDINNPRLNFASSAFDTVMISPITLLIPSEDNIANPVHFILGIIALISLGAIAIRKRNQQQTELLMLGIAVATGYLLFCYLLKWQPWGNRLVLPLFVLQSPMIADLIMRLRLVKLDRILLTLLSIVAIFYALTPIRHPLIALPTQQWSPEYLGHHQSASILTLKRQEIYYSASAKQLNAPHRTAIDKIVDQYQCRTIGFFSGFDDIEYPLWVLLKEKTAGDFRLKHVRVNNESQKFLSEIPDSQVCVLLFSEGQVKAVELP
ncbi:hypothetical protein LEP3755_38990 [Leptolyngbya sp. NIES-3755]|nr:hypothetical protein LEP3755_38990 [Leptolyngbya sp. NIES-3755]